MARRLPVQHLPHTRVVHYIDPSVPANLAQYGQLDRAEMIRQQQRNTELYLRWKTRQEEIKERDRKFRRFWTGFGALAGLLFVIGLLITGWLLWTVIGLGTLAVPAILLLASGLAVGGHRCITIVQHMH